MSLKNLKSPRDFLRIMYIWKSHSKKAFITLVGVIMFFAYIWTPTYTSTAKVVVLPKTAEGSVITGGRDESKIALVSMEDLNTEMQLMVSEKVLRDTINSFSANGNGGLGLKAKDDSFTDIIVDKIKYVYKETLIFLRLKQRIDPFEASVKLLKNSIKVEPVPMSNAILISLNSEMPKAAAKVLNRLLEIYVQQHNDVYLQKQGMQFFEKQGTNYNIKLIEAEDKLKKFQGQWDIVYIEKQKEANISRISDLNDGLEKAEASYKEKFHRVTLLERALAENKKDVLISNEMRTIPVIVELETSVVPLLVKRSEILTNFTKDSVEYKNIQGQINVLKEEIREEIKRVINSDKLELETLRTKIATLKQDINKLNQTNNTLNLKEAELYQLERDVQLYRNNYMLYAAKTEDAKIFQERLNLRLANISIADPAIIPAEPSFPNRMSLLFTSLIVGFFVAGGVPFIMEYLDRSFKTPEDIKDILSISNVCVFPEIEPGN